MPSCVGSVSDTAGSSASPCRGHVATSGRLPATWCTSTPKKLGRVGTGGGHRFAGRSEERRARGIGWEFLHVAVDDRTRVPYVERLRSEHFPLAGREVAREGTEVMLRLRMRRAPYYVWYSYDEATGLDGAVTFLRLFHTKQQTPEPRLSDRQTT